MSLVATPDMDQLEDYRLLEELAIGTTGRVYAARRTAPLGGHNLFALKVIDDTLASDVRFVMLLNDGVLRLKRFEHPDIAPALEVVRSERLGVAMPLVDGQPLDRALKAWREQERPNDPVVALWIVQRLASALNAAHGEGLVHGHLAPDQILLTYDGEVRLIGLGLAEARGAISPSDRRRAFLAPEVLRTGVATAASDIHSLARIFHHTIAGPNSVLADPGVEPPAWLPPLRSYGVTIHPALEAMTEGMLAASPRARPALDDIESTMTSALGSRGVTVRSQVARLMQTAFTSEQAGARLRRERAETAPDDAPPPDDYAAPRLARRSIADVDTDPESRPGALLGDREAQAAVELSADEPIPDSVRIRPPRRTASTYGWTGSGAGRRDVASTDIFTGDSIRAEAAAEPPPRAAADTPARGADEVAGADPRLRALESGNDEDLMALVDAIVSQSTPPRGVTATHAHAGVGLTSDRPARRFEAADSGGMVYPPEEYSHPAAMGPPEPTVPVRARATAAPVSGGNGAVRPTTPPPATRPIHWPAAASSPSDFGGPALGADGSAHPSAAASSAEAEDETLPLPEPLPPDAIFSDDVPRLPVGTVLGERYRIEDVIGEGGVSVVYRCSHSFLRKDVAIKVLRPELATMPPVVERFHREARSVAQLDHPNIVRVIDFGKSNSGSLFLVMDLIEGVSLADQIEREGWLVPTSAVRLVISILTGLEHAHGRGVIHRDLKPDNIMIVGVENGTTEVKILDFGIAKLGDVEIGSRPITEAGMVFGTPRYMSPEQAAGEPVDHRSDLFAVGIILYQLLSGQLPFDGETTVQILRRVLTQPAPRLRVNGLPNATSEALADVVDQALAKNPEDRFPSARTMREALQACFPL